MSFIDAHDPAGLVLRVLGVAESTHYDWRARKVTPSRRELDDAVYWSRSSRSAPRTSSPSPTVPHTCAGATPPRRTGRAQTCGAAHAHPRTMNDYAHVSLDNQRTTLDLLNGQLVADDEVTR